MAAGEDQPQTVVCDPLIVHFRLFAIVSVDLLCDFPERGVEPGTAADDVDGLEAPGRNKPRPRIGRHAIPRPLFDRRGECIVQCLFGQIEFTEQADERSEDSPRLGAIDGIDQLAHPFGCDVAHGSDSLYSPMTLTNTRLGLRPSNSP